MTPSKLREKVISERVEWIRRMVTELNSLPVENYDTFHSDSKNFAAAESYLRRALEALFDLGRHILSKGFGEGVPEYKQIAHELLKVGVLSKEEAETLRILAGYRNRMVHFYNGISDQEIYEICTQELGDIEHLLEAILRWIKQHPDMIERSL
ncbi:MAG: DUF86 domain-containing protein [Candidatus Hodarchaeota archaeon]